MAKKIIITILILLIISSLSFIGYIVVSQNSNFKLNLTNLWPFGSKTTQVPKVPINFFPKAENVIDIPNSIQNTGTSSLANDENSLISNSINSNQNLAGLSAVGLAVLNDKEEKVLFIDRASGNLYEINNQNNLIRLTNETILGVGEVYWGEDKTGEQVILRQTTNNLTQIVNLIGLIKDSTDSNLNQLQLTDQVLNPNIKAITVAPDGSKFFTLEPSDNGIIGYTNDWAGKSKKKVWSFAFSDWQPAWPKADLISLQTKASVNVSGYLYFLNLNTGNFTKILSQIAGLTTKVSPDGKKIIFSKSSLGKFDLYLYDVTSQKTNSPGINTLPEKCVWADNNILYCAVPRVIPTGSYPDNWYQGKISFTDDLWQINVTQNITTLLFSPKSNVDLINLVIASKRGWLYAINKIDNSIQSFTLPLQ